VSDAVVRPVMDNIPAAGYLFLSDGREMHRQLDQEMDRPLSRHVNKFYRSEPCILTCAACAGDRWRGLEQGDGDLLADGQTHRDGRTCTVRYKASAPYYACSAAHVSACVLGATAHILSKQ
jgi:hypothetical protein